MEVFPSALLRHVYTLSIFIVLYVLPLFIIAGCYTSMAVVLCRQRVTMTGRGNISSTHTKRVVRARRRVARMVLVVVVVFAVCWLPIHCVNLMTVIVKIQVTRHITVLKMISYCLSYLSSVINPFIYSFMNRTFRKAFHSTLYCNRDNSQTVQETTRYKGAKNSVKMLRSPGKDTNEPNSSQLQTSNPLSSTHSCCICDSNDSDLGSDSWFGPGDFSNAKPEHSHSKIALVVVSDPVLTTKANLLRDNSSNCEEHLVSLGDSSEVITFGAHLPGSHAYTYPPSPTYGMHQLQELLSYMEKTFHDKLASLPSTAV